ncbi:hypothetical protein SALBM311S_07023 [Streptomyces alboniger]
MPGQRIPLPRQVTYTLFDFARTSGTSSADSTTSTGTRLHRHPTARLPESDRRAPREPCRRGAGRAGHTSTGVSAERLSMKELTEKTARPGPAGP